MQVIGLIRGLLVLLAFFGAGVLLQKWLHIPLPGNLLGMLLLTLCLAAGWVKLDHVEQASSLLLKHMLLFFVPILVGVAHYFDLLKQSLWPVLIALLAGPPLVMLTSGGILQRYINQRRRKEQAEQAGGERSALHA
jgi:holin-like protein